MIHNVLIFQRQYESLLIFLIFFTKKNTTLLTYPKSPGSTGINSSYGDGYDWAG